MPVAYGLFLGVAQLFLTKPNDLGIGSPISTYSLASQFDGSTKLVWADNTNGTGFPKPNDIMAHITSGLNARQLAAIRQVSSPYDIPPTCPQNFNLFSECYAAVAFNSMPSSANDSTPLNYTIRSDAGLFFIDVQGHRSDFEKRVLPLQWAVDSAIIELRTGVKLPPPQEWPFTRETNAEQALKTRLSFIRGLRQLLVLALFILFLGIVYQLPGAFMGERASLVTSHMQAMGVLETARIMSWHVSISLAYLPAWVIVGIIWHFRIFSGTSLGLVVIIHILLGLSLASYSMFLGVWFSHSPQLAAVSSTFFTILLAVLALVLSHITAGASVVFTLIFPPSFYIFVIRALCGWELALNGTHITRGDPDNGLIILPLIVVTIINIFMWPTLTAWIEHMLYDARNPRTSGRADSWKFWRHTTPAAMNETQHADSAISIRELGKDFPQGIFRNRSVTAIGELSLEIPRNGIYVILGSNGAGKSTCLSIIGGLLGRTRGSITFNRTHASPNDSHKPRHGVLGLVPQKNVLFPELTCYQTLSLWSSIKRPVGAKQEDLKMLLEDCDLKAKIYSNAETLSGGQKRKLQLAVGMVGGSEILLVDECTSGVDPLSRRALWKTLTSVKHDRTIVFTTHFLDEADLLGDNVAILTAPGKLVAHGTPVELKTRLGAGYIIHVHFQSAAESKSNELVDERAGTLLGLIKQHTPLAVRNDATTEVISYQLHCKDVASIGNALETVEAHKSSLGIVSYDINGSTLEDIFVRLMDESNRKPEVVESKHSEDSVDLPDDHAPLELSNGCAQNSLRQASTIMYKRWLVLKRSWFTPLLMVVIAIAGSCIPLFFMNGRQETCAVDFDVADNIPLFLPLSPLYGSIFGTAGQFAHLLTAPPNLLPLLGDITDGIQTTNLIDNATFVQTIGSEFHNLTLGGVSVDFSSNSALVAWEASAPSISGPSLLNLVSNLLYNKALNSTGRNLDIANIISANYQSLPAIDGGSLFALKWVAFFGATMGVFPAFFALYVSKERRSSVQAMQLSNGLSNPIGLWLGHLLFDGIFCIIVSTLITVVFATASNQFHGLGFFWLIMTLYGLTAALFAYCACLITKSPLAAFAIVAGYQVIMFILYLAGYLLTLTYAKTSEAAHIITIIHFTVSLASPVASVLRACLISVNLFSLLCTDGTFSTRSLGAIDKFGGPILYLVVYGLILFSILVLTDSGSRRPSWSLLRGRQRRVRDLPEKLPVPTSSTDVVAAEAARAMESDDALRVLGVSKKFSGATGKAVDDVSFGVSTNTVFAMLGPNGAGKTTTFNMIRGDVVPDEGEVLIQGTSAIRHPSIARLSLGVCPQFTAIDPHLTVREHLRVYGMLKGVSKAGRLEQDIETLATAVALLPYIDRLASKLSGGNQRKLALAISLMGNPAVVLIDEFSTGLDPKTKRDMWKTFERVAVGKAIVITTHSMEEASNLATKVGILAGKLLAVGTTASLVQPYAAYEVHFSARTRESLVQAHEVMSNISGSKLAEDVATRFEVPLREGRTLASIFHTLNAHGQFAEYTIEPIGLESVFLKVIRENNILEGEKESRQRKAKRWHL